MNPIELVEHIIKGMFDFFGPRERNHELTASFGSTHGILSPSYTGFTITGKAHLLRHDSFRNLLIIGSTGSGKSTTSLIPSLLHLNGSLVVHDPSGELYDKTAGYLYTQGMRVVVFNPAKPETSDSFNVFAYGVDTSSVHKMVRLLIHASKTHASNGEPIWDELATSLISLIARTLVYKPKHFQTLHNIMHILQSFGADPEGVAHFFASTGDRSIQNEYLAFMKYEDKLRTSVIATAYGALHYILDPAIAAVTSTDTLDLTRLRREKTVLFIQNKIGEGAYYRPIMSLFFETLFGVLFRERPRDSDHDIYLLLDETSSLICPTLPLAIANLRKYRVGMTLVLQDYTQLISLYGPEAAETIRSNCYARIVYGGGSPGSCDEFSRILGAYSYTDTDGIKRTRPLLTPDEIRMIPQNKALFLAGIQRPMLITLTPYYASAKLRQLTQLPPPPRPLRFNHHLSYYPLTIEKLHDPLTTTIHANLS